MKRKMLKYISNMVKVFLTAPREINIAAKPLETQILENTTFPCDVSF